MFGLLRAMPWYMHLVVSAAIASLAVWIHGDMVRIEQEKAAALEQPAPEPVPLGAFRRDRDIHLADEVHVLGRIDPAFNYHLTMERRGRDTERLMFVLFDSAQPAEDRMARAAILIPPAAKERFIAWVDASNPPAQVEADMAANGFDTPALRFNGTEDASPRLRGVAEDAFDESGLTRAPNFIYVEPFLDGRTAALAPKPDLPRQAAMVVGGFAALFFLAALVKFRGRRRRIALSAARPAAALVSRSADSAIRTQRRSRFRLLLPVTIGLGLLLAVQSPSGRTVIALIPSLLVPILVLAAIAWLSRRLFRRRRGVRPEPQQALLQAVNQTEVTLGGQGHNSASEDSAETTEGAPVDWGETPLWQAFRDVEYIDPRLAPRHDSPEFFIWNQATDEEAAGAYEPSPVRAGSSGPMAEASGRSFARRVRRLRGA